MKTMLNRFSPLSLGLALALLAPGCNSRTGQKGSNVHPAASAKKLYWIQPLKGHPVHELTQIAFKAGCRKAGYPCAVVGTETWDVGGTIALAEDVLAEGNAAGMAIWAGTPAFNSFIAKAARAGIPVILPHFPVKQGTVPGVTGVISCDPAAYARNAARAIGRLIHGHGTIAVTQGSFNTTENLVSASFKSAMAEEYPHVQVLRPVEEGFDSPTAIAKAVAILQGNPAVVAAFSTTGGGPLTWAQAQKETGRKLVIIGMDYTRINLDLVKSGQVYAVIGQPLWDESFGAAQLLAKAIHGEKIPYWTKLPAPLITKDKLAPYYALLDKVEAALKKQ